jgi:hypothetical protein
VTPTASLHRLFPLLPFVLAPPPSHSSLVSYTTLSTITPVYSQPAHSLHLTSAFDTQYSHPFEHNKGHAYCLIPLISKDSTHRRHMDSRPVESNPNYTTLTTKPTTSPLEDSFDEQQERLPSSQQSESLNRNPSVSTAGSYSHRDSRVQSIYDRYLYRQESQRVARNLSTRSPGKKLKRLTSIKERMSSSPSTKKKRQSMASHHKDNRESKPENSAWAGMMMGNMSSDDSDSDDSDREVKARRVPAASSSTKATSTAKARTSWSSRAVAVGSRPPDSASQNPPTLKLLGLKSVKDGGAPIGLSSKQSSHLDVKQQHQQPRNASPPFDFVSEESKSDRIISTSDYGDDAGRHGSYIDFGGAANSKIQASPSRGYQLQDGPSKMASSSLEPPSSASAKGAVSPRTALTQQLGLATPQQSPLRLDHESTGYFPPMQSQSQASKSPPRNLMPGGHNRPQGDRSPQAPSPVVTPTSAHPIPLQRGPPSTGFPASPNYAMQPPSNLGQMRSNAPAPMPIPLPSPVYPPSSGPLMGSNPPPSYQRPSIDNRSASSNGPGFSDSPQLGGRQMARRQPSLLRRSMAFITGNDPTHPHQRQPSAGVVNGQKKGLFRRSLAILTNRPIQPTAIPVNDYCDSPLPRVAGFVDEKPKNRKSEYLGASGMGDEWDYSGYGAKFWKRFSVAQRREMEGANKDSEAFRRKMARRRQYIIIMSLLGGLAIIGGVAAIIIWRESVPASATPGAVDRQKDGVILNESPSVNGGSATTADTTYISAAAATPAVAQNAAVASAATTTTRRHHHHNADNRKRALATPLAPVVDQIKREIMSSAPSYFGGVHPLPRSLIPAGHLIQRRKHSDRALKLAPEEA